MRTIKIKEDFQIPGTDVVLEKGDQIEVLKEDSIVSWREFSRNGLPHQIAKFAIEYLGSLRLEGLSDDAEIKGRSLILETGDSTIKLSPQDSDLVTMYTDYEYGFKISLEKNNAVAYFYYRT